jgi:DNA-3-methyladenine glycosylase
MAALPPDFYDRPVLDVARDLIGCTVLHEGVGGLIVETEAYHESEPACHAFVGLTPRTVPLFGKPGVAYVYRSYGIHALLNAVCEPEGVGAAVLIRALAPTDGIDLMRQRRERPGSSSGSGDRGPLRERDLCSGPGRLTQALDIGLELNTTSLIDGPIQFLGREGGGEEPDIVKGPRIGITKAPDLPWRFCLVGDPNVSRPQPWRTSRTKVAPTPNK